MGTKNNKETRDSAGRILKMKKATREFIAMELVSYFFSFLFFDCLWIECMKRNEAEEKKHEEKNGKRNTLLMPKHERNKFQHGKEKKFSSFIIKLRSLTRKICRKFED